MKVWMLTNGTYSDFRVVAIYATREVAERALAVIEATYSDGPMVMEMDVHHDVDLAMEVTYHVPRVRRSGEPTVVRQYVSRYPSELLPGEVDEYPTSRRPTERPTGWNYIGNDEAAVAACARARSQEWHGEVVLARHADDAG